jgi:hypothetical protein
LSCEPLSRSRALDYAPERVNVEREEHVKEESV